MDQLIKKLGLGYNKVYPKTYTDNVFDKASERNLSEILSGFNCYFLPYNGSKKSTRLLVPKSFRKIGLWITYVLFDNTVIIEYYNGVSIDDKSWSDGNNWTLASNFLVGDVSVSAEGNWIVNGKDTGVSAKGEQGITPLIRVSDNKFLVSYNQGKHWFDIADTPVFTTFREYNNKILKSTDEGKTWTDVSDYIAAWFRWSLDNKILISRTNTANDWQDLSPAFENNIRIKDIISSINDAPTDSPNGTAFLVGPNDDNEYEVYVKGTNGWVNIGSHNATTIPSEAAIELNSITGLLKLIYNSESQIQDATIDERGRLVLTLEI